MSEHPSDFRAVSFWSCCCFHESSTLDVTDGPSCVMDGPHRPSWGTIAGTRVALDELQACKPALLSAFIVI